MNSLYTIYISNRIENKRSQDGSFAIVHMFHLEEQVQPPLTYSPLLKKGNSVGIEELMVVSVSRTRRLIFGIEFDQLFPTE